MGWLGDRPSGVSGAGDGCEQRRREVEREWVVVVSGGCEERRGVFEFPKWEHYGNIRVKSWQPLRLFIVYCLPALWRVNNGTPSLWAKTAAEDQGGQGVHRLPTLADASKDS